MSGVGFNRNEALPIHVLMDVDFQKPSVLILKGFSVIVNTYMCATETDTRRCPEQASMALKPSAAVY